MRTSRVLALCLALATFAVGTCVEHPQPEHLAEIEGELIVQLIEEEQAGVSGEELAGKLQENGRELTETEREALPQAEHLAEIEGELIVQLIEEEQAGVSGEELAGKLRENGRELNEMEREVVEQLLEEDLAKRSGRELAMMLRQNQEERKRGSLEERSAGCTIEGYKASCCAETSFSIFFKKITLGACVTAEFLPEEIGLHMTITVLGAKLFDKTVSAHNPDALCVNVPVLRVVSVCLELSDLKIEGKHFSGCMGIKPKVFGASVANINLGCITIP